MRYSRKIYLRKSKPPPDPMTTFTPAQRDILEAAAMSCLIEFAGAYRPLGRLSAADDGFDLADIAYLIKRQCLVSDDVSLTLTPYGRRMAALSKTRRENFARFWKGRIPA